MVPQTRHVDDLGFAVLSPDEQLLATGSWDKTLKIWDVRTGTILRSFRTDFGKPGEARWQGRERLVASDGPLVVVWDVITGRRLQVFDAGVTVNALDVLPSGEIVAIDKRRSMWVLSATATLVRDVHADTVASATAAEVAVVAGLGAAFVFNNQGDAQVLYRYGLDGSKPTTPWRIPERKGLSATSLAVAPDGAQVAIGYDDTVIEVRAMADGALLAELRGHDIDFAISPDGRTAAVATGDELQV